MEDLGSGALVDLQNFGISGEPSVLDSLRAGVDVVTYSGDKLLGGPQAGLISGRADLVARMRANSLFRALRVDKLTYAALEATLLAYVKRDHDAIPTLKMMRLTKEEIGKRAESLRSTGPLIETEHRNHRWRIRNRRRRRAVFGPAHSPAGLDLRRPQRRRVVRPSARFRSAHHRSRRRRASAAGFAHGVSQIRISLIAAALATNRVVVFLASNLIGRSLHHRAFHSHDRGTDRGAGGAPDSDARRYPRLPHVAAAASIQS